MATVVLNSTLLSLRTLEAVEEISPWFRKRVILANVPSFLFLVPGNIHMHLRSVFWYWGTFECTLVPFLVPGYIRQNQPSGNHPFANSRQKGLGMAIFKRTFARAVWNVRQCQGTIISEIARACQKCSALLHQPLALKTRCFSSKRKTQRKNGSLL